MKVDDRRPQTKTIIWRDGRVQIFDADGIEITREVAMRIRERNYTAERPDRRRARMARKRRRGWA